MNQVLNIEEAGLIFGGLLAAILLGLGGHYILFRAAERIANGARSAVQGAVICHSRGPIRVILVLITILLALSLLPVEQDYREALGHVVSVGMIASVAWLAVTLTQIFEDVVSARQGKDQWDDHSARQIQTRVRLLRRIALGLISVVSVGAILMLFPGVQHLGTSLLASAGIVGLVAGIAARPVLSNLIAGLQIAMTQPIRIGDVVVVEGEWEKIEEIYTTYVVVCIWDLRRLVLPLSYFMERPFQNWTRRTDALLAKAFIYADYTVPVDQIRQELHHLLAASGMWDGAVWKLQVTNATDRVIELRALMSATDSDNAWNLQCYVRERLIEFMQKQLPRSLPRTRKMTENSSEAFVRCDETSG